MKRRNILFFFMGTILAMLLAGCDNSEETTINDADKLAVEEIKSSMEKQVSDLQLKLEEMQQNLDAVDKENGNQGLELYTLNQIINAISDVEVKYGYIDSISENDEVILKRVEMLSDLTRPNGYRIDDLNRNEVFQLDENVLYFVVHEVAPEMVDFIEFKKQAVDSKLFTFTIVDGKLMVIKEQYLP